MATPVALNKSTKVSPPPSPKLRAKSKSKSPEPPRPSSPKPEAKAELQTPQPDDKVREPTAAPAEPVSTESVSDQEVIIDMETFGQILELDEEDNHEFSMGMAWAYFEQATITFKDMAKALEAEDLPTLSSLGHFLKGSSAALGISKVQRSCELIQHYGNCRDEEANIDLSKEEALERITTMVEVVRKEYSEAESWLRKYYKENAPDETPPSD